MDRGKHPLLLPYTYTPSIKTVGLLLHLQYYQRCEPMILKMWIKSKFVLWQPRFNNLLTEQRIKKFTFLKYSFFENVLLLLIWRNSLQTPPLDDILLVNFTLSNSVILVEHIIMWRRGFEIFLIDHYGGDTGNKKNHW